MNKNLNSLLGIPHFRSDFQEFISFKIDSNFKNLIKMKKRSSDYTGIITDLCACSDNETVYFSFEKSLSQKIKKQKNDLIKNKKVIRGSESVEAKRKVIENDLEEFCSDFMSSIYKKRSAQLRKTINENSMANFLIKNSNLSYLQMTIKLAEITEDPVLAQFYKTKDLFFVLIAYNCSISTLRKILKNPLFIKYESSINERINQIKIYQKETVKWNLF